MTAIEFFLHVITLGLNLSQICEHSDKHWVSNCDRLQPCPCTLCHTSRDPPIVRHTYRTAQIFSSICIHTFVFQGDLPCFMGLLSLFFFRGSFVSKVLSGVILVRLPSVRTHPLQ